MKLLTSIDILLDALVGIVAFIVGAYYILTGKNVQLGVLLLILTYVIEGRVETKTEKFRAEFGTN
jgi:hypothetical protein